MVVGTSQSSVGGVTHRLLFLSKTNMAGHLWSLGYPPWQAQYLLHDFPRGTLPLASSLHKAEELRVSTTEFADVMDITMFLAASNILRPVAGVSLLVVEQSTNAELLCGGSVPAGPVAGAGGLVTEYSVQPVTVLRALGGI